MARRPSRIGPSPVGPAYKRFTGEKARKFAAIPKVYAPPSFGVSYSSFKSAPREEASGKRSYKDSRGRTRWGKPHIVQRYHRRKRAK